MLDSLLFAHLPRPNAYTRAFIRVYRFLIYSQLRNNVYINICDMFSLGEKMMEFLPTLGFLLLIPVTMLVLVHYLDKARGSRVRVHKHVEKEELQKIVNESLL